MTNIIKFRRVKVGKKRGSRTLYGKLFQEKKGIINSHQYNNLRKTGW